MSTHPFSNLDELFADGLIQAVMKADRVDPRALRTLLGGVAGRAAARWRPSSAPPQAGRISTALPPANARDRDAAGRSNHL